MSISVNEINVIRRSLENVYNSVTFCRSEKFNTIWNVEESRKHGISEYIVEEKQVIVIFDKKDMNVEFGIIQDNGIIDIDKFMSNLVYQDLIRHYSLSKFEYDECKNVAENKGFRLIDMKRVSNHDEDRHIFSTLVQNELSEYVAYYYNSTYKGFSNGYYTTDYKLAREKFKSRIEV